jgi:hypothetical protein
LQNDGFLDESGAGQPEQAEKDQSLDEVKSRVYALLDDAFSLLSNSVTSMG